MNTGFPDPETVRTALALASRAPSVHNTQPWRWRIDPAGLHLYADPARQLPHTDPDGRDLILSCGIAVQHCVTAFAAVGWRSRVRRLPDPDDPDHLATLEFSPQTADYVDVALAAAIPRRRTDRRHYSCWPVPVGDIALMAARAARAGVTLYQVQDVGGLHDIVAQSIRDHLTQDYLAELTTWSGRYFSVSGVPARNTPFPDPAAKIPTRLFAGAALPMAPGSSAGDDNAVVLALGTRHDDRLARLRAGEATGVVLLTATSAGLASCPVTEPLETPQTRAAVRADIFGDGHHPQMLLRVGWAPINADPLPATPRRDLADFVEWVG
ncbi:Acg family FMN-binding oxidoreductase [Mycobacterium avium]|uniref:NAD(P)H nitroreductase n=2 Tax=Mycobacterium avium TaxID=1764 RepID=A0A2A2ZEX3_MYCAV|nr:nitroreductase family protein [Mycobacterium avium]ETB00649.1 NAD(P)H nitroreductase [Mycobacterium avium 10-5581]ATO64006.2 nitroreductase family protein [Mycobacterium avium subsp. hominissuis]ATO68560.1 nitroreductase family protein [Mycobacterium avium subsp. hominissuis]ATO73101.1 nitroreductase family protein [Mycobacterium avium subsp. hominissuis]ETZ44584.1 putative NAD(P)H nitroreductase [Mycobacterium avium MAV_120709_2344]